MSIWEERGETRHRDVVGEEVELWNIVPHFTLRGELEAAVSRQERINKKTAFTIAMMNIFGAILLSLDAARGAALTLSNARKAAARKSIGKWNGKRLQRVICSIVL